MPSWKEKYERASVIVSCGMTGLRFNGIGIPHLNQFPYFWVSNL